MVDYVMLNTSGVALPKNELCFYTFTGASAGIQYQDDTEIPHGVIDGNDGTATAGITLPNITWFYISNYTNLGQYIQDFCQMIQASPVKQWSMCVQDDTRWAVYLINGASANCVWDVTYKYGCNGADALTLASFGTSARIYWHLNGVYTS